MKEQLSQTLPEHLRAIVLKIALEKDLVDAVKSSVLFSNVAPKICHSNNHSGAKLKRRNPRCPVLDKHYGDSCIIPEPAYVG